MAGSTINGNCGAAQVNSIVTLVPIDARGAITGTPQQAQVSSTGAYTFSGLASGTYTMRISSPAPNPSSAVAPWPQTQVLTMPIITVDGSSTYAV
jgi:hypothetical protein